MKRLFIPAKYKEKITLTKKLIDLLPKNIGLVTTIQFIDQLEDIKRQLINNNKKPVIGKSLQPNDGQVLGCDVTTALSAEGVDAFLYIGDGQFHPLGVAMGTKKEVFEFDPFTKKFSKITQQEIDAYHKKRKGAYIRFLSSKNIGVLFSLKQGQFTALKTVDHLKKKYADKKFYAFIGDTLDLGQLENFPFIECWVNTACTRIADDRKGIVNLSEI